jgi:hypothetical protein
VVGLRLRRFCYSFLATPLLAEGPPVILHHRTSEGVITLVAESDLGGLSLSACDPFELKVARWGWKPPASLLVCVEGQDEDRSGKAF